MNDIDTIITEIIDLILNPNITDKERSILVAFKNKSKITDRDIMVLAEELRILAVGNIAKQESLSPEIAQLYKEIATYGEFEKNLGRGLIALGVVR